MVSKKFTKSWLFQITFITYLILFVSCSDKRVYPDKPQIEKVYIRSYKRLPTPFGRGIQDSIVLGAYIKGGNSDLGIDRPVSLGDAARFINQGNWTNYKITILRLKDNKFVPVDPLVSRDVAFFPSFTIANSKKAKEGYLYFNRIFVYYQNPVMSPTKFLIQIRDNDLNESNVVETDTVVVPYPE